MTDKPDTLAPWETGDTSPREGADDNAAYEEILKHALNGADVPQMRKAGAEMGLQQGQVDKLIGRAQVEAATILNPGGSGAAPMHPPSQGAYGAPDTQRGTGSTGQPHAEDEAGNSRGAQMLIGGVLIVAGIAATWIDYSLTEAGGSYSIWWGASVYGLYILIKGAMRTH
ncbi:hypothetical protein OAU50_02305 [Planctomycetota bacterium]|nr:hypothetical protein [Planctomycetota bacterium]